MLYVQMWQMRNEMTIVVNSVNYQNKLLKVFHTGLNKEKRSNLCNITGRPL